ncbi:hypothetical protein DL766_004167 [Monosporascus sp. MC13-8B]|uniref:Uncharacterized protein n=1 Tax=Monosporascus cannonballus TaxID=155416 RepID=A0ABY0H2K7_9PEZI|nr:hypothetical protein DL763_010231 [Monosporascus cannonballus]RYO83191.1 hypothetical protein DL762_006236 [Monosporascus cannonballus]RYP31980.1 hypothetical protein DL766_004167 [Monosporascus sp. MC13-8B]
MPAAGIPNGNANSPAMKRRHTENDQHSYAKRRKETSNNSECFCGNKIIELSSDDNNDESCPNEPVQGESVDGEQNSERPASNREEDADITDNMRGAAYGHKGLGGGVRQSDRRGAPGGRAFEAFRMA